MGMRQGSWKRVGLKAMEDLTAGPKDQRTEDRKGGDGNHPEERAPQSSSTSQPPHQGGLQRGIIGALPDELGTDDGSRLLAMLQRRPDAPGDGLGVGLGPSPAGAFQQPVAEAGPFALAPSQHHAPQAPGMKLPRAQDFGGGGAGFLAPALAPQAPMHGGANLLFGGDSTWSPHLNLQGQQDGWRL